MRTVAIALTCLSALGMVGCQPQSTRPMIGMASLTQVQVHTGGGGVQAGNTCDWAFDGECDDVRYLGAVTNACRPNTDESDCRGLPLRPSEDLVGNTCQWAYDGECDDDRYVGAITRACRRGTDEADCQGLPLRSAGQEEGNTCTYAFDDECDDNRYIGAMSGVC